MDENHIDPGFYYVASGFGWTVKEWDGRNWWSVGEEIPDRGGENILGRVPEPPEDDGGQE